MTNDIQAGIPPKLSHVENKAMPVPSSFAIQKEWLIYLPAHCFTFYTDNQINYTNEDNQYPGIFCNRGVPDLQKPYQAENPVEPIRLYFLFLIMLTSSLT